MLTQERLKELLSYDPATGAFVRRTTVGRHIAGTEPGTIDDYGYVRITIDGKKYRGQRLAFLYMTGTFPECEVDHEDRVRTNNSWNNLREATTQQNAANRTSQRDNMLKGVSRVGERYSAAIKVNGKRRYLGTFETPQEANAKYLEVANDSFGEFARAA